MARSQEWSKRVLSGHPIVVHPHQGKGTLPSVQTSRPDRGRRGVLDLLPATLRGYAEALDPKRDAVLIVVDADNDDPNKLEAEISEAVSSVAPTLRVIVRDAVEETEAFYLGDLRGAPARLPRSRHGPGAQL